VHKNVTAVWGESIPAARVELGESRSTSHASNGTLMGNHTRAMTTRLAALTTPAIKPPGCGCPAAPAHGYEPIIQRLRAPACTRLSN